MTNPYKIDSPGVVSFSGGRTSGYMLWHIIEAYGGKLPNDIKVIFCNTGKERPETLEFVERCSIEWDVDVIWLEYTSTLKTDPLKVFRNGKSESKFKHGFKVVNYATASRDGGPMLEIINARGMLPNMKARFCTVECKIRTCQRYCKQIGWNKGWTNAIGMRHDEPHRVAKLRSTNRHNKEEAVVPLYESRVTKPMILDWWSNQPFDLKLKDYEGNCDLCFLKSPGKIQRIMKDRPDLADWWINLESEGRGKSKGPEYSLFRIDRPRYATQMELANRQGLFDDVDEEDELSISCSCTG